MNERSLGATIECERAYSVIDLSMGPQFVPCHSHFTPSFVTLESDVPPPATHASRTSRSLAPDLAQVAVVYVCHAVSNVYRRRRPAWTVPIERTYVIREVGDHRLHDVRFNYRRGSRLSCGDKTPSSSCEAAPTTPRPRASSRQLTYRPVLDHYTEHRPERTLCGSTRRRFGFCTFARGTSFRGGPRISPRDVPIVARTRAVDRTTISFRRPPIAGGSGFRQRSHLGQSRPGALGSPVPASREPGPALARSRLFHKVPARCLTCSTPVGTHGAVLGRFRLGASFNGWTGHCQPAAECTA